MRVGPVAGNRVVHHSSQALLVSHGFIPLLVVPISSRHSFSLCLTWFPLQHQALLSFTKPLGQVSRMNHFSLLLNDEDAEAIREIGFPPIAKHKEL